VHIEFDKLLTFGLGVYLLIDLLFYATVVPRCCDKL
jgi:hypothetical protein